MGGASSWRGCAALASGLALMSRMQGWGGGMAGCVARVLVTFERLLGALASVRSESLASRATLAWTDGGSDGLASAPRCASSLACLCRPVVMAIIWRSVYSILREVVVLCLRRHGAKSWGSEKPGTAACVRVQRACACGCRGMRAPRRVHQAASRQGQAGRRSIYWAAGLGRHGHMQAERRGSTRARTGDSNRRLGVHSPEMRCSRAKAQHQRHLVGKKTTKRARRDGHRGTAGGARSFVGTRHVGVLVRAGRVTTAEREHAAGQAGPKPRIIIANT